MIENHSQRVVALLVLAALTACEGGADAAPGDGVRGAGEAGTESGEVNVYSHRHYDVDERLFDLFTERTGIEVNVVSAGADELLARLEAEGANTPADVLITVDAGRLHRAKVRGLLQPIESAALEDAVPEHLRDPDGEWYGLTRRARIIAYARDRVDPESVRTYAALADPEWRGRVLVRSSDNVYNQSLLASLIAHEGAEAARSWAEGVVANMARRPSGGDTDQIKALAAGQGDVAVVNTYYLARLQSSEDAEERRVGAMVGVVFPEQDGRGTHVNVSAAGVTAPARNRANAIRLLEFLVSDEAQRLFAQGSQEYPVRADVPMSETLQGWGEFRADTLDLARLGELNARAVRIFDEAGWR